MTHVPTATYRLQLNSQFTFADAAKVLDYLVALGISHVYLSPVLTSRKGSTHGYDVTDPSQVDPELGGEAGFQLFQKELQSRGLGLLLDVVPNHMAASRENRWWSDVLELGPASPYSAYFDVSWRRPDGSEGKVMLPFLGETFGEALDNGLLKLSFGGSQLSISYHDNRFPLAPASYADVLGRNADALKAAVLPDSGEYLEFQGILAAARALRAGSGNPSAARSSFHALRGRLEKLAADSPAIRAFVDKNVEELNGHNGDVASRSSLERILASQHYSLAYWRTTGDEINYRRFFSIDDLVGVRVEDPEVFDATHAVLARLCSQSPRPGLRVDHIDGLHDPQAYLERLALLCGTKEDPGYLIVEKILEANEKLPATWPIDGTTGYEFLNSCQRLFVDEKNAAALERRYAEWTGEREGFEDVAYEKKMFVMRELFRVEMRALGRELANLAHDDRYSRELVSYHLREALIETTACLPRYRTYIRSVDVTPEDRAVITHAIDQGRRRNAAIESRVFDFLREVLLLEAAPHVRPEQRESRLAFVMRWQQFTGPITAKGLEDTALYDYYPLTALNEVGGWPTTASPRHSTFAEFAHDRQHRWPNSLNATTTHDTKRSEDVRSRIVVLSEIPDDWFGALNRWSKLNEKWIAEVGGESVPDRNEQYFLYQTLVGTWPTDLRLWDKWVERLKEYMVKAGREAKVHTRWVKPNVEREAAIQKFVGAILDRSANSDFVNDFAKFQRATSEYGMLNGLSQALLKIAAPGIPDFYQGSETWDFRLVDPDNRTPVCFETLEKMVNKMGSPTAEELDAMLTHWHDGRAKLHLVASALRFRDAHAELFARGTCDFLVTGGPHADRVIAMRRALKNDEVLAVLPRCVASKKMPLDRAGRRVFWKDTTIELGSQRKWTNVLAQGWSQAAPLDARVSMADIFDAFPVALYHSSR
jgi:(1->4)-alpha-D-glucan 1-alpha-D-glucosylmutase